MAAFAPKRMKTMAEQFPSLLAIIDAIEQLTPSQRRQLQRRLYAGGLFVPDTLLTDQDRLAAAPALGENFLRQREQNPSPPNSARHPQNGQTGANAAVPILAKQNSTRSTEPPSYRSPISGTVVLGMPESSTQELDPHLMPPLPGQAPEQPIIMIVERGTFILRWPGESPQRARLNFNVQVTDQEARYDTLIRVIEIVQKRLSDISADAKSARLDIRSEDSLFIRQAKGEIPCDDVILRVRRNKVRELLQSFGGWRMSLIQ